MSFRRIGAQRDILGESPLWEAAEQALYWVDIRRPALRRYDWARDEVETRAMPELVGSIALAGSGRLLVAIGERVALYDWATERFETVAEIPVRIEGHRFNDGRCDRQGRFWVGTMHNVTRAPEGVLYRLDPAGGLIPVVGEICIPNSLAWSPDGRTMYFADSLRYGIDRYEYDPETGAVGVGRPFVRTTEPGFPDGSTVDAAGYLWNAEFKAGRVVRYAPDGAVAEVIAAPVDRPTSCALGGADLKTLFVTTTSQSMSEAEMAAEPLAGALLAWEVEVPGVAEPYWEAALSAAGAGR